MARFAAAIAALAVWAVLPSVGCRTAAPPGAGEGAGPVPAGAVYVGPSACKGCHAAIGATFARTGMGRSFYPLTAETAVEDFERRNVVDVEATGVRYRMTRRDGRFYMKQFVVEASGREAAVDEREMRFVVGSGNHSRSYVTEVDGKLFQMPVCWYPSLGAWDLCPGFEHKNDYFARELSATCVFCHNALMEREAGTRNRYRQPLPAGIDCERCHGPGSLHVARWRDGSEAPTGERDDTIVNPRRLPQPVRIQLCMQCHLADSINTERVGRHERTLESFRPGEPLTAVMVPFRWKEALPAEFGIAGQADRFVLSRCWRESGGKIDCLTCHDPHVPVYRKDRPAGFFREKCLTCHEVAACSGPADRRRRTSPPDDCVACHMRRAEPGDHPHTTFTDHWIRRRPEAGEPRARSTVALEPVIPEAFEALSAADRAYYEGRAYFLRGNDLGGPARRMAMAEAARALERASSAGFARAEGPFFLGKALLAGGRPEDAAAAFERAHALDPAYADAALAWGQALLRARRTAEAAEVFRGILARDPAHAGALAELARGALVESRPEEALDLYRRALAAEPWNARIRANVATILAGTGRAAEAEDAMREALRYGPGEADLWKAYAEMLSAAGEAGEASEAAARAARLARRGVPSSRGRGMMGM